MADMEEASRLVGMGLLRRAADVLFGVPLRAVATISEGVLESLEALHPCHRHSKISPPSGVPPPESPLVGAFDEITADTVRTCLRRMQGSAGPSGLTPLMLQSLCLTNGPEHLALCEAIADFARDFAQSLCFADRLDCFRAARLVPARKPNGGIRPIGVGECLRRLVGKTIGLVAKGSVQQACGVEQLCGGISGATEAAAKAFHELWSKSDTEAVLLVDARNAFNTLSRDHALTSVRDSCPLLAIPLWNLYSSASDLFVKGGHCLLSREGTQGHGENDMALRCL